MSLLAQSKEQHGMNLFILWKQFNYIIFKAPNLRFNTIAVMYRSIPSLTIFSAIPYIRWIANIYKYTLHLCYNYVNSPEDKEDKPKCRWYLAEKKSFIKYLLSTFCKISLFDQLESLYPL